MTEHSPPEHSSKDSHSAFAIWVIATTLGVTVGHDLYYQRTQTPQEYADHKHIDGTARMRHNAIMRAHGLLGDAMMETNVYRRPDVARADVDEALATLRDARDRGCPATQTRIAVACRQEFTDDIARSQAWFAELLAKQR